MATTRATAQKRKRRKERIEAYLFLFFIFVIGFVFGFVIRPLAYADEPIEAYAATDDVLIVEPCPITIESEKIEPETITETEEETEAPEEPVAFYYDCPLSKELQDYIFTLCEEEGVPSSLVIALIDHESDFRADAISSTKDYGLMQINACNHEWLKENYGISNVLDPKQNILGGIKILGSIYHKYSEPHKVLMAYNMGEYGMKKAWNAGRTSTSYSVEVLTLWNSYQAVYEMEVNSGTQSN